MLASIIVLKTWDVWDILKHQGVREGIKYTFWELGFYALEYSKHTRVAAAINN
jgi:hypothetical protein